MTCVETRRTQKRTYPVVSSYFETTKDILWMDEILHHLRNPGMIDPLVNTKPKTVSSGFNSVQDFVHPQYHAN